MLDVDLKGKKLLLLGGLNNTADLVQLAHRNGVLLGVADYNKNTLLKGIADFAHDISIYDEDLVVKLVREEGYDGVISAFNEGLGPVTKRISERIGKWAPLTVEQLRMSTNKKFFKHICEKYGIPVPQGYEVKFTDEIDRADIKYPVIIKPVDSASSVGVMPCKDAEELKRGYEYAIAHSKSKDVIVEQYLPFDEINVTYIAQDGEIQLAAIHDRYFNTEQKSATKAPDLYIYPSRYTDLYIEKYNQKIIAMLHGIGVQNGSLFLQVIVHDGDMYFYEAGMRLNGCKTYQILEYENGYNTFEHLMQLALTGSMGKRVQFDAKFKRWYATLNVLGEPGATVAEYRGEEALYTYPWMIHIAKRYRVGETIPPDSAGTLVQDTTRIHVMADTKEELVKRIAKVNELYQILDQNGQSIILKPHDLREILEGLDYEL